MLWIRKYYEEKRISEDVINMFMQSLRSGMYIKNAHQKVDIVLF